MRWQQEPLSSVPLQFIVSVSIFNLYGAIILYTYTVELKVEFSVIFEIRIQHSCLVIWRKVIQMREYMDMSG